MYALTLSPLRLGFTGQTAISLDKSKRLTSGGAGSQALRSRHDFNLSGVTEGFIGPRWLSSLRLGFGSNLSYSTSELKSSTAQSSADSDWSLSNNVFASLTIFPGSRIPFDLNVAFTQFYNDDQGLFSRAIRYRLTQAYSPLTRRSLRMVASLSGDMTTADTREHERIVTFNLEDTYLGHALSGEVELRRSEDDVEARASTVITGEHDWQSDAVSVSDFINFINSDSAGGLATREVEVLQFFNNTRWRPQAYKSRLDYLAISRGVLSSVVVGEVDARVSSFSHSSRLNYRPSANVSVYGNFNVNSSDGLLTTGESFGGDYRGEQGSFRGWSHDWSVGTGLSMSQADTEDSAAVRASFGQRLQRRFDGGAGSAPRVSVNQSIAGRLYDSSGGEDFALSHSVEYYRSFENIDHGYASFQLTGSDSRWISIADESQLLVARVDHQLATRAGGILDSDISFELFRHDSEDQAHAEVGYLLGGKVRYQRDSFWGVPRLLYLARIGADIDQYLVTEDQGLKSVGFTWLLHNELRWRWGLLSLSGLLDFTGTRDVTDASLRFEIRRQWRPLN